MNRLGHRLCIACAAILSALALAQSSGAELVQAPVNRSAAPGDLAERLVFRSIATLGPEPIALLGNKASGRSHWVAVGDPGRDYTLKEITENHVIVAPRDTTEEIRLPRVSDPAAGNGPKPYSKAWINSRANPMLLQYQIISGKMLGGEWDNLTDGKKAQILEFYRQHGWELIPSKTGLGPSQFEWRNLYETERAAAIEVNRDRFAQTLNPEQQALWKEMRGFQNIYPADYGRFSDEQRKLIAARQLVIDEFKKSLTPEQKAEHESIRDFAKVSWK